MKKLVLFSTLAGLLAAGLFMGGCSEADAPRNADVAVPSPIATPTVDINLATPGEVHRIPIEGIEVGAEVGDRIPHFTLGLVDGVTISSEQLMDNGRPTFLFFFATT